MGWSFILLAPRDVDGIVEEGFLDKAIKNTNEFAFDLNLNRFGFHKALVFVLEGGAAEG